MTDFADPPRNIFIGTANVLQEAQDEKDREIEALKLRIDVLSKVISEYALKLVELEVKLKEAEYGNIHD